MAGCLLMAGLSGCMKYEKKANSHTTGTTTMVCDNTFENIMAQEIDVFEYQYPDAHILVRYATQAEAFDSLMSLNTKTIVVSRDVTKQEREILKNKRRTVRSTKIAVDAVALIVNPANPVGKLTLKEVADILSGESRQWNDIWPTDDLGEISVIFDDKASSLVTYMRDSLLNGGELGPNVYAQGSIPDVFRTVMENKNAIGVLGVSWITSDMSSADISREDLAHSVLSDDPVEGATLTDKVKVLSIYREGEATRIQAVSGKYLQRHLPPLQTDIHDHHWRLGQSRRRILCLRDRRHRTENNHENGHPAGPRHTHTGRPA